MWGAILTLTDESCHSSDPTGIYLNLLTPAQIQLTI